jgi:hypothetical protein
VLFNIQMNSNQKIIALVTLTLILTLILSLTVIGQTINTPRKIYPISSNMQFISEPTEKITDLPQLPQSLTGQNRQRTTNNIKITINNQVTNYNIQHSHNHNIRHHRTYYPYVVRYS